MTSAPLKRYCPKCDDKFQNTNDCMSIEVKGMCMYCSRNTPKGYQSRKSPDEIAERESIKRIKDRESLSLDEFHKRHNQ